MRGVTEFAISVPLYVYLAALRYFARTNLFTGISQLQFLFQRELLIWICLALTLLQVEDNNILVSTIRSLLRTNLLESNLARIRKNMSTRTSVIPPVSQSDGAIFLQYLRSQEELYAVPWPSVTGIKGASFLRAWDGSFCKRVFPQALKERKLLSGMG